MYRKITQKLEQWKASPYRKPLVLQGARQVGKTYSVLEFGRTHYENVAYFNFESDPTLCDLFAGRIDPEHLLPVLSAVSRQTIVEGKKLIFFDEIQVCERALTALKYFYEQTPGYHIIVAGSLLGIAVNRHAFSFPVGKVEFMTMRPMDMEEFFLAMGEDFYVEQIRDCFAGDAPMPAPLHEEALKRYREYLLVGGMPECVRQFVSTGDHLLVQNTQNDILASYLNDMSKYNTENEIKKTRLTYNSITAQLSQKNTRFRYKLVKKGGRASELENAIEWLVLSGIVSRVFAVEQIMKPLGNYENTDDFKIYMSDVGLLAAKNKLVAEDILYPSAALNQFKGGMVENYVQAQLLCNGYDTYYWHSASEAEVDFIIQRQGSIVPIEVKSADNTRAKSLNTYIKRYRPEYALKVSSKNFSFEDGKKTVPLYAAFCI